MIRAIKLVLIYFGYQVGFTCLMMFFSTAYHYLNGTFTGDYTTIGLESTILALLLANLAMIWHLYRFGYLEHTRQTYSWINLPTVIAVILAGLSFMYIGNWLNELIRLPDWLESTFKELQNHTGGVIAIVITGPVVEELLFRGAIQGYLQKRLSPRKAILISALIFDVIHLNPAQVVFAFIYGVLLGWIFYKTGSLLLCMILHIVNNGTAVILERIFPEVTYMNEILSSPLLYRVLTIAIILFTGACYWLYRQPPKEYNQHEP
ncbi:MAG: CPBP family intramembrane metalloprotease [Bacteroides sp.]|nr:CPBP family intramembrane metalloprotease [Bacteroides sp.]